MKNLIKILALVFFVSSALISCNDDSDVKTEPVIKNFELGSDHDNPNNAKGYVGKDLHLGADIFAPNKVEKIVIKIHEKGHHHHTSSEAHEEWGNIEITDYKGEVNPHIHKHIDIPATAEPGDYHFHFKVVDQKGLTTEIEKDLMILKK